MRKPSGDWINLHIPMRTAIACLAALAGILTVMAASTVLPSPFFGGDEAHRMHMAWTPVVRMDNRVWLPTLQVHIWILYLLQAPLFAYKLIPCLYYFAAVTLIGTITFELAGRTRLGLAMACTVALLFARQEMMLRFGTSLMQEIIGIALFFLLLQGGALQLRRKWWLLLAAAPALMARDSFWIYLFVVTGWNARKIVADRRYICSFALLWAVPLVWLALIPLGYWMIDGRFPEIPTEWPLGINKTENQAVTSFGDTLNSLWESLIRTHALYLLAGLILMWPVIRFGRGMVSEANSPAADFARHFVPFSLISLAIIYGLFLLFDPFQATPGSSRMSAPLLIHGFVWIVVLWVLATKTSALRGALVAALMVLGLIPSLNLAHWWGDRSDYRAVRAEHARIASDLDALAPGRTDRICIVDENYFGVLRRLLAPTLYRNRIMVLQTAGESLAGCAAAITPSESRLPADAGFVEARRFTIEDGGYVLYRKGP